MSATQIAQGDRFPLVVGLRDSAGAAVYPPVNATATFRMVGRKTKTVVTGSATIDPANTDQVTWTPGSSDTAVPDLYDAQFTVTWPGGAEVRHFPSKVGPSALDGLVIEVCPAP